MKTTLVSSTILAALLLAGCGSNNTSSYADKVVSTGEVLPYTVLRSDLQNGKQVGSTFEIRNGGFGSAATAHPSNINQFYALTDRGPNATFTGVDGKGKKFPTPEYTPRIGLFELSSTGKISLVKEILFKDTNNKNISGLPNSIALGGTGEVPYDAEGKSIKDANGNIAFDDFGLDAEGLAALKDGTFWVSDEYGPHMVHFDATGKEIGRINPFVNDTRTQLNLPAEFSNRRPNRGMEGLTITPDQKTLVGIMQSTMYNPSKAVKSLDITRIVTVNLETGKISQYLYKQEKAANSNSEIVALSADQFLVIERDGKFLADDPNAQKHVYKIDLRTGTDLEAMTITGDLVQDDNLGLTIAQKTLEEVVLADGNWNTLTSYQITPVSKMLVVDMINKVSYAHDKMEGLWVINPTTLGVLNDDDFATWSSSGVLEQKYLDDANTTVDASTLYVIQGLDLSSK